MMEDVKTHKFHLNRDDSHGEKVNRHTCPLQDLVCHSKSEQGMNARFYQIQFFRKIFHQIDEQQSVPLLSKSFD